MVTYSGTPLAKGAIRFVTEGETPGAGGVGEIVNGKYEIPLTHGLKEGEYLVMVYGFKPSGRKVTIDDKGTQIDQELQIVPRRYNDATELRQAIKRGMNSLDFDLQK